MHLNRSWIISHRWSCLPVLYDSANHSVEGTRLNTGQVLVPAVESMRVSHISSVGGSSDGLSMVNETL